jgi:hypothetical protein
MNWYNAIKNSTCTILCYKAILEFLKMFNFTIHCVINEI